MYGRYTIFLILVIVITSCISSSSSIEQTYDSTSIKPQTIRSQDHYFPDGASPDYQRYRDGVIDLSNDGATPPQDVNGRFLYPQFSGKSSYLFDEYGAPSDSYIVVDQDPNLDVYTGGFIGLVTDTPPGEDGYSQEQYITQVRPKDIL